MEEAGRIMARPGVVWPTAVPGQGRLLLAPLVRRVMCTSAEGKRLCLPWPYGAASLFKPSRKASLFALALS
jgi:hypothetical protein